MHARYYSLLGFLASTLLFGQAPTEPAKSPCADTKTSRPSIMVIPRVKEGQDIRKVIDEDFTSRVAISKVKEAFDQRGFTTVDFVAKLKAATAEDIFSTEAVSDYKTQLLQYANPDIYVEVDYSTRLAGGLTTATVILSGYDCATGNALGNKDGSKSNQLDDAAILVGGIMANIADPFLSVMQTKFTEMIEDGRQVTVVFRFKDGSTWSETAEVETKEFKEFGQVVEEWIAEKAVKHNYGAPNATGNAIFYSDVRIPLRDPVTCKNYTTSMFRRDITAMLKSCGATSTPTVNGAQIIMLID